VSSAWRRRGANADDCDAAGQQHIVSQQRRKRNDDEPHLIDKIDARLFFSSEAGIQETPRSAGEAPKQEWSSFSYKVFLCSWSYFFSRYPTKSDIWRRRGVNRLPFLWVEDTSSLHAVPPFYVFHTLFRIMSNGRFHDLVISPVHLREILIRILNIFIYKIVIRTIPSIRATMVAARVP
jgi:hypothetical protein